jgi:hypothetical protein
MADPFAFRLRAYSAVHFEFDQQLALAWPDASAILISEYTGGVDGRAYPITLLGEIRGPADSLEDVQTRLATALANVLPIIALAGNAAIADPLPVGAYGLDLTEPQPFTWYRTPPATAWFPPGERRIAPDVVQSLMGAVGHHPENELLHRAIEDYRRALEHWIPEQKLMSGEFLFIAAETLSRCLIESRAAAKGITPNNLARLEQATGPDQLRGRILRDEVFAGDDAAWGALREASDGFEHGYMAVDQVRRSMEAVLERGFGLVRRALIDASDPDLEAKETLLSHDYDQPRGLVPAIHIVRGTISRKDPDQPPAEMGLELDLEWRSTEIVASRTESGKLRLEMPSNIEVTGLPANTQLRVEGAGIRAAHISEAELPDSETE